MTKKYETITKQTQYGEVVVKYPNIAYSSDYIPVSIKLEANSNSTRAGFLLQVGSLRLMEQLTADEPLRIVDLGVFAQSFFRPLLFGNDWTEKESYHADLPAIYEDNETVKTAKISIKFDSGETISFEMLLAWGDSFYADKTNKFDRSDRSDRSYYPESSHDVIDYNKGYPLLFSTLVNNNQKELLALDVYNGNSISISSVLSAKSVVNIEHLISRFAIKWSYTPQRLLLKWNDDNETQSFGVFDDTFDSTFLHETELKQFEINKVDFSMCLCEINVERRCESLRMHKMVYLRWVDSCGCPQYYLFHVVAESVELIGNNSKVLLKSTANYTQEKYTETTGQNKQTKQTMKIMAPLVEKRVRNRLLSLFSSPFADMLVECDNGGYQKWLRVQVTSESLQLLPDELDDFDLQISYQLPKLF